MNRTDHDKLLLYIEPKKKNKSTEPINDDIVEIMKLAISEAESGVIDYNSHNLFRTNTCYKGYHTTECGKDSSCQDYLLKNGMITNSLCVYYLQYYRSSIPTSEMSKVNQLVSFYKSKRG